MRIGDLEFRQYVLKECELPAAELALMSHNELFDYICEYEGYGKYSGYSLRNLVRCVYGIDLNRYKEYLPEDELAALNGWDED